MPKTLPTIKAAIPQRCPSCDVPIVVPQGDTIVDQRRYERGYHITFHRVSDGRMVGGHGCS